MAARTWALRAAVVVGIGPWGGLAGGALFGLAAIGLGAERSIESWGIWLALVGFVLGFVASCYLGFRLVQRWPRAAGGVVVLSAVLVVVSSLWR